MNLGAALINLADIAICTSNDFHTMHLNFRGAEFDTMHKKVLQKYYDKAAEDADSWYEAAAMFDEISPPLNNAAQRIEWQQDMSLGDTFDDATAKAGVVHRCSDLMENYLKALTVVFNALGTQTQCAKSIGVQNTVQTALEYWSKEWAYFNKRRA